MVEQAANAKKASVELHSLQSLGWGAVAMQQLGSLINWTGSDKFQAPPVDPWTALTVLTNNSATPESTVAPQPPAVEPAAVSSPEPAAQAEITPPSTEEQAHAEQAAADRAAAEKLAAEKLG